jgi:hypothetical protein
MNIEYFIGTVIEVPDETKQKFEILAEIPGITDSVRAFPSRDQLDEPVPGDKILLVCLDPILHSYFTYKKLKEDDFIGFRAEGKTISITPDDMTIQVDDKCTVKMDNDGNMEVEAQGDIKITVTGNTTINTTGNTKVESTGNVEIKGATVKIDGTSNIASGQPGGFCSLPSCLFTGAPHTSNTLN